MLSCVIYYLIENYVCVDYLSCQSKNLISISSKLKFEQTMFNILFGIGIPELVLNLVSYHGFMKKPDSTVIINCLYFLVNNYLSKKIYIIERNSKQLSMLPNYLKLGINFIDKLDTDFFMKKNKGTCSVANTIKNYIFRKLCIWFTNKTSIRIYKRK